MMNDTTPATYALLGDAYMSVQNVREEGIDLRNGMTDSAKTSDTSV